MLHFKSLKLSGFKSFIEKTDLEISNGLTGIVGPNGCGKSNLVEALRWTMGESSAKRMRGGGMEDVIFAGTEKRPARNFAEVILTLDNQARTAPAAYNNLEEIQISRKIVRDQGSAYRINGRPARARDVQLLFADTLSGASSPALVSQGKIASIINAKPLQRRMILEESAGITGLFARRHEAELRLKQAEQNLMRIEDTTGGMESRLSALKRQARQAARYKEFSSEIRALDQLIAYLEWRAGEDQLIAYKKEFDVYETGVSEQMATVTQLNKTYITQTEDIPKLREAEASAAAALQKFQLDLQRIEDRAAQRTQGIEDTTRQIEQTSRDIDHNKKELAEYKTSLTRTENEQTKITEDESGAINVIEAKQKTLADSHQNVTDLENQHNTATAGEAARAEQEKSLARTIEQDERRASNLAQKMEQQTAAQSDLREQQNGFDDLDSKQAEISAHNENINKLAEKIEVAEKQQAALESELEVLEENHQEISLNKSKLESEIDTLNDFIHSFAQNSDSSILGDVHAESGFEAALSRAIGDGLQASLDQNADTYWMELSRTSLELPKGLKSLKDVVNAPKALNHALSQVGYVEDVATGKEFLPKLEQGQSIVSKDGHYWRWDGYCVKAEAPDTQTIFLKQKNRLESLQTKLPDLEKKHNTLIQKIEKSKESITNLKSQKSKLDDEKSTLERSVQLLEKEVAAGQIRHESNARELESLKRTLDEFEHERAELLKSIKETKAALSSIQSVKDEKTSQSLDDLRQQLQQAREVYQDHISTLQRLEQQQNSRKIRLRALADERITLQNRIIRAEEHLSAQENRLVEYKEKLTALQDQDAPEHSDHNKEEYLSKIDTLEKERGLHSDKLNIKETEASETARALKQAENALSEARENRARVQALFGAAQETQGNILRSIQEKFETTPDGLLNALPKVEDYAENTLEEKRERRQQLLRQREAIGAVNLQAETEAEALESELGGLLHEKNDLVDAVEELRGGIKELNTEARGRLNITFERVNAHFQALFKRLFVGGQAHLALIEADDPLEAGLEIFAQPPGKSLQALSLMSGGEQTMTSIALIFAMFLTNPAPICVLDEIDAPLDDANVDKVCDLLEEISESTKTRFLIVTHHRLTMARMDRIYGVTMAEKGVSQLISLDMQQSFGFLEEAEAA